MTPIEPLESRTLFSAGALDPSFGVGGTAIVNLDSAFISSKQFIAQVNGKLLVIGFGVNAQPQLLRLNADGTLDTTFANGGIVPLEPGVANYQAEGLAVASNGDIYVGLPSEVLRFTADGQADSTFADGGALALDPNVQLTSMALENDGSLMLCTQRNTHPDSAYPGGDIPYEISLFHVNADGSVDAHFGTGGEVDVVQSFGTVPDAMVVQPDGKVIIAGSINHGLTTVAGEKPMPGTLIQRYNTDGTLDPTFKIAKAVGLGLAPQSMALTSTGKLVIETMTGVQKFEIERLTARGGIDQNFGVNGKQHVKVSTPVYINTAGLIIDSAGRIVIATESGRNTPTASAILVRLTPGGSFDNAFGHHGTVITPAPFNTAVTSVFQDNNDILLGESQQGADASDQELAIVAYQAGNAVAAKSRR